MSATVTRVALSHLRFATTIGQTQKWTVVELKQNGGRGKVVQLKQKHRRFWMVSVCWMLGWQQQIVVDGANWWLNSELCCPSRIESTQLNYFSE